MQHNLSPEQKAQYDEIYDLVLAFFKGDKRKTEIWISIPNLNLGNIAPIDLIKRNKGHKVLEFVKNAKDAD